jgi:hypothetical protein
MVPARGEQESRVSITLTTSNITSDYYPYPGNQPGLIVWVSGLDGTTDGDHYAGPGVTPPTNTPDGVTVENVVVVNSTTITCDLVISQIATTGIRWVQVRHSGGSSPSQNFQVGFPSDFLVFFG